jgi:hypothetical protein
MRLLPQAAWLFNPVPPRRLLSRNQPAGQERQLPTSSDRAPLAGFKMRFHRRAPKELIKAILHGTFAIS